MPPAINNYLHGLARSFGALYEALEVPRVARCVVATLLVVHTGLLAYSAYVHSPTLNEPAHLVAGLSHWKFGRFELYRVNPPLVRMVAALPVMAAGYKEDWSGFHEGPGARPEMGMGEDFVAANGERSFFLFMIARWACIPFSWLGAIVCYLWARDLFGRPSGVMACAIWCFEPNILAHASLITPDAHATALGLAACYTFWRWLRKPTWSQAALTGVVLGLAELAKTTLILFYPLWPLMWLIYRLPTLASFSKTRALSRQVSPKLADSSFGETRLRGPMKLNDWLREAGMLALRMLVGLYVLNLGYAFEGSFTQLNEFHFVSNMFTGEEPGDRKQETDNPQSAIRNPQSINNPQSAIPNPKSINRFATSWLGSLPVPFPKNYLLGIDIQQRDFENYGRPSYLRGEWRDHGWWYYYLYACAIKIPLGLWLLGALALITCFKTRTPRVRTSKKPASASLATENVQPQATFRDQFILLFPAVVVFVVVSSKTGFNEHMRYVLPCFPFVFIWISQVARTFKAGNQEASRTASAGGGVGAIPSLADG